MMKTYGEFRIAYVRNHYELIKIATDECILSGDTLSELEADIKEMGLADYIE